MDLDGLNNLSLNPEPDLSATIEARADGSGTTVIQACTLASGLLCEGKSGSSGGLHASSGSESTPFSFEPVGTSLDNSELGSYWAGLQGGEEGKEIVVTWDTSHVFKVTLPAPVTIKAPAEGAVVARGEAPISVTYEPSGEPERIAWSLTVDCLPKASWSTSGELVTDTGELVLDEEALKGELDTGGCPASIAIRREREGTAETTRKGSILGVQTRSQTFTLTP
jgi:hypothetical protein